jgi:hypothetical protein
MRRRRAETATIGILHHRFVMRCNAMRPQQQSLL